MQLKTNNSAHIQHISGLPKDWQEKKSRAGQLCSRAPFYNDMTKRYALDFRERAGRMGYKVQTSVKNFEMTLERRQQQSGGGGENGDNPVAAVKTPQQRTMLQN